jgi:PAS domain S-box-containing protein
MTNAEPEDGAVRPESETAWPVRILVVDDRPENLVALGALLDDAGRTLVLARSGREALRELLRQQFALILLDVNMPGMDGFETAQLIRQRPSSAHTPIIFITAQHDEGLATRSYALGAVDYISTPVNGDVLRAKAGVFVELFRKTEENRWQAELLRRAEQRLRRRAEERLRQADEQLRLIVESAADWAVFSLDADGRIATWNAGAERLFGFTEAEALGGDSAILLAEEARVEERHWRRAQADGRAEVDAWFQRKGGERFFGRGVLSAMLGPDGEITGYSKFVHDVTERKREEEARARYAEELQTANRMKDEFLAILSHELRTPLNAIIGWTHMLRKQRLEPDVARQALDAIARNGQAQLGLINDILDVSRFIAGKLRLALEPTDVREVVQLAADNGTLPAQSKGIDLEVQFRDEPLVVCGDAERLQQVVWNLVSNAVKFTPQGGHVRVEAFRRGDTVVVRVSDDGVGIAPSFLPHVFERFRQSDSSSGRSHGGLGLGLAIVKHLVDLHGGSVEVDSAGEGQGATVEVVLPAHSAAGAALKPAAPVVGDGAGVKRVPGVRCLVVDDDPDSRVLLKTVLEREGLIVALADSSTSALEQLPAAQLLIADIGMPGEDGHWLIRQVRSQPAERGGHVPSIALTAYATENDREQAIGAGFDRHVSKPVECQNLLLTIAELLKETGTAPPTDRL